MNLYSVTAGSCGYDQYDAFIIWAKSREEALSLAITAAGDWDNNFKEDATVTRVSKPEVSGVLMGSFNAG